jgi:hypothetical protein
VSLIAVTAATAGAVVALRGGGDPADDSPAAAMRVTAWLTPNLPATPRVAAPVSWRGPLQRARPGWTVVGYPSSRPGDVLILDAGETRGLSSARLQRLVTRSELLASFSDVQVRQVLDRPRTAVLQARRDAGARLVTDVDVRLTPRAWKDLIAGNVDARLVDLLAAAAGAGHTVDVAMFDRDEKSRAAGAPARSMRVTAVDGQLVDDTGGTVGLRVLRALELQQGDGSGTVTVDSSPRPAVLHVAYPLPERQP